uniref:Homeobox domain-containing protein n=1 Tax=Acrobeloides nanus TaxID=290746 RepID=A0A914CD35_9BILA
MAEESSKFNEVAKFRNFDSEEVATTSQTNQVSAINSTVERKRRTRTTFTRWQLQILEEKFQVQQYMVGAQRVDLARSMGLNEIQVKVWFQNRRIKWRRQQREAVKDRDAKSADFSEKC